MESELYLPGEKGKAWFAIYTRHQHEKAAAQALSVKGFDVFLPLYHAAHQWKDRVKQLSLPLFPNYIFICGNLEKRGAIVCTPGVYGIVGVAGVPAPIPQEEIDTVRQVVEKGSRVEPHPFLKTGDRVRVKSGPLEGIEGILVRKKNLYRLVVSVELLGKSIAAEVDAPAIERATSRVDAPPALLPHVSATAFGRAREQ